MAALPQLKTLALHLPQFRTRLLILGTGQLAKELCEVLVGNHSGAYEVVGFLDRDPAQIGQRPANLPILGTYGQMFELVERFDVHSVAVCLEDRRAVLPVQTLLDFKAMGIDVVDGHRLYEEKSGRLSIDVLKPSTLIFSEGFRRPPLIMLLKRLVDVALSLAGLVALIPLFVLVGILIKLDSPGPVFYKQIRVGYRGRPYTIWKFRSMRQDAERHGALWASTDDPRVSRVGRWIRKWRIDELPQLINVLKGEMSLVGPRPERPVFVQELRNAIPYYDLRHTVRPGITGWAQTRFRYGASAEDSHMKLQYDLYYVKNLALPLDFRIMTESIRVVLLGEGAR
jgi:sugar transferase (PEP-CTERM system associated)